MKTWSLYSAMSENQLIRLRSAQNLWKANISILKQHSYDLHIIAPEYQKLIPIEMINEINTWTTSKNLVSFLLPSITGKQSFSYTYNTKLTDTKQRPPAVI